MVITKYSLVCGSLTLESLQIAEQNIGQFMAQLICDLFQFSWARYSCGSLQNNHQKQEEGGNSFQGINK